MAAAAGGAQLPRFAIIWAPIPIISWLFPAIGHMGLSTSTGAAVDFAGPFMVNEDVDGCTIFGRPARYVPLNPRLARAWAEGSAGRATTPAGGGNSTKEPQAQLRGGAGGAPGVGDDMDAVARWWDEQLAVTITSFRRQSYNILGNNCHALVADFLNEVKYKGSSTWDMVRLAAWVFAFGHHTSWSGFLLTWLPFAVIVGVGGYFGRLWFLVAWAAIMVPLLAWFVVYNCVLGGPPCSAKRRRGGR